MRSAVVLAAAAYAIGARAQANDLSATNNVTSLLGTWSSNPAVMTGGVSRLTNNDSADR